MTLFNEILESFENDDIKKFAEKIIAEAPPYFWSVPASSSLKYHPAFARTTPLGLAKHTVALCRFLNYMFALESISSQFTSRERDLLRCAGIAHDMWKSGTQEDYEHSKWTKFDHPLVAAAHIRDMVGLTQNDLEFIAHAIESHMGQFNTSKRSPNIILPKPNDKYQIVLHLADYLASRAEINMEFDESDCGDIAKPALPDINEYRLTFGKHNGKTIPEIAEIDAQYLRWAKENIEKEPVKSLVQEFEIK